LGVDVNFTKAFCLSLLFAALAFGQGGRYDNIVIDQQGNGVAAASIRVCVAGSISVPCTTTPIFSDLALTVPRANPFTADARGNFFFYATGGTRYVVQISGTGITTFTLPDQFVAVATGSGGACPTCWIDGGNAQASATPSIGNTNAKTLRWLTNNVNRLEITSAGAWNWPTTSGPYNIANEGATGRFQWPQAFTEQDTEPHGEIIGIGNGIATNFVFTVRHRPIVPSSVVVLVNSVSQGTDDGAGNLTGAGIASGTINYTTGAINVTFNAAPGNNLFVSITDTISDNLDIGTTETNAFLVVRNDIKIGGPASNRGIGGKFGQFGYLSLTTEDTGGAPTDADFATVRVYAKSNTVDALGAKKLYFIDSSANEYRVCDSVTGGCGISAITGTSPIVIDGGGTNVTCPGCEVAPAFLTKGGLVGGYNIATTGMTLFGSATFLQPFMPVSGYLHNLGFCIDAAGTAGSSMSLSWRKYGPTGGAAGVTTDLLDTLMTPGASTGCFQQSLRPFQVVRFDYLDAFRVSTGTPPAMRGWSAIFIGSTVQPLGVSQGTTVAASTTDWATAGQHAAIAGATSETNSANTVPYAGTMSALCIRTTTAQPATGSLVVTLRDSGVDTLVTFTIAANAQSGIYCDLVNSHVFTAGDYYAIALINNATAASATIGGLGWIFTPTTAGRGLLIFPKALNALTASVNNFIPAFSRENAGPGTVETDVVSPVPAAGTLQSFSCFVDTAPAADLTVTVYRNGSASTITGTITAAGGTGVKTIAGTQAYSIGDTWSLLFATGAGAQAVISGCSGEFVYS
jgi:hypothetical protein